MTRALAIAALVLGLACTHAQPPTQGFKTYPVSAAFGAHAVRLSSEQRAWLLRVLHSKTYGPQRARLRFADMPGRQVPLVIYVSRALNGEPDSGGHVIGEVCNSEFDPGGDGLFAATEASCMAPTPLPVVP